MECLFCRISAGQIPATIVYEDEDLLAFRDIKPQAPTHLLVIPKRHIATINDLQHEETLLVGNMIVCAKNLAAQEKLSHDGYRLVFNVNSGGGQEVYHIHLHVLGGRQMTWPPG
ncbi:MAG: histidine triad nucleotide-binding protein [Legionella sp.]|nr:MAG: histidine triad nucleotide-binding protein [Legionella sp.]PJD97701.1 MAG: histidine triad nucleotide-binding protein [Legionella sp.]